MSTTINDIPTPNDTSATRKGRAGACFDLADCEACTRVAFGAIGAMTAEQLAEGLGSLGAALDFWQARLDYLEECCWVESHHGGPEEAARACRIAILKMRTAMAGGQTFRHHVACCELVSEETSKNTYRIETADGCVRRLIVSRLDGGYVLNVENDIESDLLLGERVRRAIRRDFLRKHVAACKAGIAAAESALKVIGETDSLMAMLRCITSEVHDRQCAHRNGLPLEGVNAPWPGLPGEFSWKGNKRTESMNTTTTDETRRT